MAFQKIKDDISRWSSRLSRRKDDVATPPSEPDTADIAAEPSTTGLPSPSDGYIQQPLVQHPAVRPLSANLCPRPSISESAPPLSPASWLRGDPVEILDDPDVSQDGAIKDDQSQQTSSASESSQSSSPYSWSRADWDHAIHSNPPIVHEEVKPHVHTVYEPHRTRTIHFHEHRYIYQPVIDPTPYVPA